MSSHIDQFAADHNLDANSVRWLADYIIRETPPEHADELLADAEWVQACTESWLRLVRNMAVAAHNDQRGTARLILDKLTSEVTA